MSFISKVYAQTAIEKLKEILGKQGYETWLLKRGTKKGEQALEEQARLTLENMELAAQKEKAWEYRL